MGSSAVSFSDIPQGATVVQGYSDLPKGATVVHGEPSAASRFWSAFAPQAQNILTHPLGVSQAVGQPVDINNPPKLQWSMPGSVGEAVNRVAGPTWQEIKDFMNQATGASEFAKGNIAGGAGHLAASALPLVFGMVAGEAEHPTPQAAAQPGMMRGLAQQHPEATARAGAAAGAAAGHAVAGPIGAAVGAVVGRELGVKFATVPEAPASAAQTAPPESMTATAPMPAGRVQPTVSMTINPDVQLWEGSTAEVAGPKPTAAPQKAASSQPAAPSQGAIDLAKALGVGTPVRAEARWGKEAWERMVRGKDTVADAVDAAVPAGEVNDAATNVAGAALATGNIQHAQDVIQAATQVPIGKGPGSMPPTDFTLQPRNPNGTLAQQPAARALQWEDFLDDKAWKSRMEADYGTDLGPAPEKNWANTLESLQAKALQEAVPTSRTGRAVQTEEVKAGIERARPDEAKSTLADIARQTVGAAKPGFKFAVGDAVKFAGGSGTVTRISPEFGTVQVDTGGNLPRLFGAGELKLSSGRGAQGRAAP